MASKLKNLSEYDKKTMPSVADKSIGVVVSEWNPEITHALYDGCVNALIENGIKEDNILTAQVPGAFELPSGAKILASSKQVDAVICLGCVIKGETSHNEYINHAVATGLTTLGVMSGKPFIYGVLTPNDMQQAKDRAGGKHGNKGVEAAITALRMVGLKSEISDNKKKIGFQ